MPVVNTNLYQQCELPISDLAYTATIPVPPTELLYNSFTVDGVEGASNEMAADGTTPISFRYTVPAGKVAIPGRVIFEIMDQIIQFEFFAGLGVELTNGILICIRDVDDTILVDFTHGEPFHATHDFVLLSGGDVTVLQTGLGVDPDFVAVRWTLSRAGYVPYMTAGQSFEILIQDNLAALSHFHAFIQGRVVSEVFDT